MGSGNFCHHSLADLAPADKPPLTAKLHDRLLSPRPVRWAIAVLRWKKYLKTILKIQKVEPVLKFAPPSILAAHTASTSTTAKGFMQTLIHRDTKPACAGLGFFPDRRFFVRRRAVLGRSGSVSVRPEPGLACPEPVEGSKDGRVLSALAGGFDRLSPNGLVLKWS